MANLIITVIAIALVAAASMMGAYYAGSAFQNGQMAADSATVINEGVQVAGAWNAYLGDNINTTPTNITALTQSNYIASGGYLQVIPTIPASAGGVVAFPLFIASATAIVGGNSGTHYFAYADVGRHASGVTAGISDINATACIRIQKAAKGSQPSSLASLAQGTIAAAGNGTFGCGILTGSITGGLGGATVPTGDLVTGDYVMEYLLQ
jgi:hypothetical protein